VCLQHYFEYQNVHTYRPNAVVQSTLLSSINKASNLQRFHVLISRNAIAIQALGMIGQSQISMFDQDKHTPHKDRSQEVAYLQSTLTYYMCHLYTTSPLPSRCLLIYKTPPFICLSPPTLSTTSLDRQIWKPRFGHSEC
jgi:hypothetical protein